MIECNDIGVNASEVIDVNEDLTIFLTVQLENEDSIMLNEEVQPYARSRSLSFDLDTLRAELSDIGASGKRRFKNCIIM